MKNMRISTVGSLAFCLLMLGGIGSTTLSAQSPVVQSDRLGWTQAASAEEMGRLSFAVYVDGTRTAVSDFTCTPTATDVYDCVAPFPAMTPGQHSLELVAIRTEGTLALESPRSAAFVLHLYVAPAAPTGLRIIR